MVEGREPCLHRRILPQRRGDHPRRVPFRAPGRLSAVHQQGRAAGKGCGGVVGKEPLERLFPKKVPPSPEDYGVIEFLWGSGRESREMGECGIGRRPSA